MTRELERGLRATFEDRAGPVPAQEPDIADRVLARAGRVRRTRAAAAGFATAIVALVMGIVTVTGGLPGMGGGPSTPKEEAAGPNPSTTPSRDGIDSVVHPQRDKDTSFIRAADGTKIDIEDNRGVQEAVRVPGGFLVLTYATTPGEGADTGQSKRLSFYAPGKPALTLTESQGLVFSVNATGNRVALLDSYIFGSEKKPTLRVLALPSGELLGERPVLEGSEFGGWVGEQIVYGPARTLRSWDPGSNMETAAAPNRPLQMFGTNTGNYLQTPMAKIMGDQMCIVGIDVASSFKETTTPRCYLQTDVQPGVGSVSPDGRWLACVTINLPGGGVSPLTIDLSRDLAPESGGGSMMSLPPGYDMANAVWTRDSRLLLRNPDGWWAYDPQSQTLSTVSLPDGPSATPIPRYGS